jgi:exopolysaccharide production protein ExoZ
MKPIMNGTLCRSIHYGRKMQNTGQNKMKLRGIQALRAIAAILVLLQHSYYYAGLALNLESVAFRQFSFGTVGVYLFFMISGYIIYKKVDSQFFDFLLKRVFRVYPTFFLAMIVSFLLFFIFSRDNLPIITNDLSQLLLPTGNLNGSFQIPYWTLIYEIFFYVVFSVALLGIIRNARTGILVISMIWIICILYSLFIAKTELPVANPTIGQIFFAKQNLYFIVGMLLSMCDEQKPYYLLIYGLVFSLISATPVGAILRYDLNIMLLGVTIIIVFEIYNQHLPNLLVRIGDWSYGIYLLHLPVVHILYTFLAGRIDRQWQGVLIILPTALIVSALYGYLDDILYHRIFSKWASQISQNFLKNKDETSAI